MTTEQKFLKDFGKRLSQIRRKKGITQEKLGELIDMHYTYISLIERGERKATITTVWKIAKALKMDTRDLF